MSEGAKSVQELVRQRNQVLDKLARQQILDQYARIGKNNKPVICGLPGDEHRRVVFDTKEDAEAAVRAFRRMGSTRPQYIEVCPLSKRGHHHIVGRPPATTPQEPTKETADHRATNA